jgi:hypothetical protein
MSLMNYIRLHKRFYNLSRHHGVYGVQALKNKMTRLFFVISIILLSSCSLDESDGFKIFTINYTFTSGDEGWVGEFTEYPVSPSPEADSIYEWQAEAVPSPPATDGLSAYMMSCNNVSGDVFMFMKKRIDGLRPNTKYNVVFEIVLNSNAMPNQGVILKAGACQIEPRKVIENDYYVLNVDKGLDYSSGENAVSFGDIGASTENAAVTKGNVNSNEPFITQTNSKGELWLMLGTDSAFQGTTTIYFTQINIYFSVSE